MFIPEGRYWWSRKRKDTNKSGQKVPRLLFLCKLSYSFLTAEVKGYTRSIPNVFLALIFKRSFWVSLPLWTKSKAKLRALGPSWLSSCSDVFSGVVITSRFTWKILDPHSHHTVLRWGSPASYVYDSRSENTMVLKDLKSPQPKPPYPSHLPSDTWFISATTPSSGWPSLGLNASEDGALTTS